MKMLRRFGYRKLFLWGLVSVPVFVAFQTMERFILWEATTGKLVETVSTGSGYRSSRYFYIEFKVEQDLYRVRSSIGTNDTTSKFSNNSTVGILYDPDDPNNATIKYRHGQLEKLVFFAFVFGGIWVVTRISFRAFDAVDAKKER